MYFKEIRDAALLAHFNGDIGDEELAIIHDFYRSQPTVLHDWTHINFDLDGYSDEACLLQFRFHKRDIFDLADIMGFPDHIHTYNGVNIHKIEALCMTLKRYAFPCRYVDMLPLFGRSIPQICITVNTVSDFVYTRWGHLLTDLNQNWLSPASLEVYADAIERRGAGITNCWGFVDGTVRPCCRPGENQRTLYNGHKKRYTR